MILNFKIENHRSIAEQQQISMVASSLKDRTDSLRIAPGNTDVRVLPCAVIMGANASGKSNTILGIHAFKEYVLHSHQKGKPGEKIPRRHFMLSEEYFELPTRFELDFIVDDVHHSYGFEFNGDRFLKEWLFSYPHSRKRVLFERNDDKYFFGRELKGHNKLISDLTRRNSLFLSCAAQNDHDILGKIFKYIDDIIVCTYDSADEEKVIMKLSNGEIDPRVIEYLNECDIGISGHRFVEIDIPDEMLELQSKIVTLVKNHTDISRNVEPITLNKTLQLGHISSGDIRFMPLSQESSGTRRLIILLSDIFKAIDLGTSVFIDEIDASLHTEACASLFELFCSNKLNPKGAQLIATTHDTNILKIDCLRRDQIWFCEKMESGGTSVYSLSDISVKKGVDIEKGYLAGRFGGVPIVTSLEALTEMSENLEKESP